MCGGYTGEHDMNGFGRMKESLEKEGWYVGWAIGYFQDEAWCNTPYEFPEDHPHAGEEVDMDKCLFNIIQDVEKEDDFVVELESKRDRDLITEEEYEVQLDEFYEREDYEEQVLSPEEVSDSAFCFGNAKNLKEVLPLIEDAGCEVQWNGSIKQRPTISWSI